MAPSRDKRPTTRYDHSPCAVNILCGGISGSPSHWHSNGNYSTHKRRTEFGGTRDDCTERHPQLECGRFSWRGARGETGSDTRLIRRRGDEDCGRARARSPPLVRCSVTSPAAANRRTARSASRAPAEALTSRKSPALQSFLQLGRMLAGRPKQNQGTEK